MNPEEIESLAKNRGWRKLDHQENIGMISFIKFLDEKQGFIERIFNRSIRVATQCRVNVYYTKMTVGTALNHPKKGKTQLFRKRVSKETLEKIFDNPRVHTGKGYYER